MRIIIIVIVTLIVWWVFSMVLALSTYDNGSTTTPAKSKRQLRIEKHSWDRDEYWVIGALVFLLVIKLLSH